MFPRSLPLFVLPSLGFRPSSAFPCALMFSDLSDQSLGFRLAVIEKDALVDGPPLCLEQGRTDAPNSPLVVH